MREFMRKATPAAVTLLVLGCLAAERVWFHLPAAEADTYHARVRQAVAAIPQSTGDWLGVDVPVPTGAVKLLHPNALFSRRYENIQTGEHLTVLIVQVQDARDILGHYPPICYPMQGWERRATTDESWPLSGASINGMEYSFARDRLDGAASLVVDNLLLLPGGPACRNMDEIERAAQDRRRKSFGAAQVQFVFDSATPPQRRRQIVDEFLEISRPAIAAIRADGESKR